MGSYRCSSPRLTSWRPQERCREMDGVFPLSLTPARPPPFCNFLGAHHIFLGQAWAEGKGELATCRHRADSGQETDCT